ncbi:hypothetical protein ABK040_016044 [Willaertia magna]
MRKTSVNSGGDTSPRKLEERKVKKSGKLLMENPNKKFFQKTIYKRFIVLTSKKLLCFKDAEKMEKKPEEKIKLNRYTTLMDIDDHKGMKFSFALKVIVDDSSSPNSSNSNDNNNENDDNNNNFKTYWFAAENLEERKEWMKAIEDQINSLKDAQTNLTLNIVKLIESHSYDEIRSMILHGDISKYSYLHFTKENNKNTTTTTNTGQQFLTVDNNSTNNRSKTIAPGLREDDLSDDEEEEVILSNSEIQTLKQMGYQDKDTMFHIAVKCQDWKLIKFLLDQPNMDFNKRNAMDQTPLHYLIVSKNTNIDNSLLNVGNSTTSSKDGLSPRTGNGGGLSLNLGMALTNNVNTINTNGGNVSPKSNNGGYSPRSSNGGNIGLSPRGTRTTPREEILNLLIEKKNQLGKKLNLNQLDKLNGNTILNLAASLDETELVQKLIYEDANTNLENNEGIVPLHYAIQFLNIKMLEVLLKKGNANILFKKNRNTPLDDLFTNLANESKRFLMKNNGQIGNWNNDITKLLNMLKLIFGIETINVNIPIESIQEHLKELIRSYKEMDENNESNKEEKLNLIFNYLFLACLYPNEITEEKSELIIKLILQNLSFLKCKEIIMNQFKTNLLAISLKSKFTKSIQLLLNTINDKAIVLDEEVKQLVNLKEIHSGVNKTEYTNLHLSMIDFPQVCNELLEKGADVFIKSGPDHLLPILLAVQSKDLPGETGAKIVEKTFHEIQNGNQPNYSITDLVNDANPQGQTLLYFAAKNSGLAFVKMLIEKGANVGSITNTKETILTASCYGGNLPVLEYLIEEQQLDPIGSYEENYIEGSLPPIHAACKEGHLDVIKVLIEKYNVDINQCRHHLQIRPIHLAAMYGKEDVAKYLIKNNCDLNVFINSKEDKGISPLHLAALYGFPEMVNCLVKIGGMDPNQVKTESGATALDMAIKRVNLKVVKTLCELGAASSEQTLQLAIQTNNSDLIEWIEKRQSLQK